MSSNTVNGTTTTYAYDNAGVRVREATGGTSTIYLNDPQNPTGYTKAIEERDGTTNAATRSYVLGMDVEAQRDATNGTQYLITDGHGSTRELVDLTGGITQSFNYDAFGTLLNIGASAAKTPWLFGGDGLYDPASGLTYHLARWRDGFRFTSYDSFEADPASPASLHKYAFANVNPIRYADASGHFAELVEFFVAQAVQVTNFAIKSWPIVKLGLAGWDVYNIVHILEKGFNEGWDSVTNGDRIALAASSVSLLSVAPGSQFIAKGVLSTFLRIPVGRALSTFADALPYIKTYVRVVEDAPEVAAVAGRTGYFTINNAGEAVIKLRAGLTDGEKLLTLFHEYLHFVNWKWLGRAGEGIAQGGEAFTEFQQYHRAYERMSDVFESVAKIIFALSR